MAQLAASVINKPVWLDLTSADPAGSRDFYGRLLGWNLVVASDPQYGGYAVADIGGKDVAGIGPAMMPGAPTAWTIYIGTNDVEALAEKVKAAGGTVVAGPMEVGDQGKMAVFQDPTGAFIAGWEPISMNGFGPSGDNTFGWAELNSRGLDRALPFYQKVFGWVSEETPMGEGQPPYTQFAVGGEQIAGAMEMNPQMPAQVPSYWMPYFSVADVDAACKKAKDLGAQEMLAPQDFAGGRFAILSDPQGASFGLLKMTPR
jgi:predicted enzyme related to lactoylglutathione lyase